MEEKEFNKIVEDIIEPIKKSHLEFLDKILETIQDAFLKGIEVGKKLKD